MGGRHWIALCGLLFGIVQFGITLYEKDKVKTLEQAYKEAIQYRVGVSYMMYKPSGLARLMKRNSSSAQFKGDPPVVYNASDEQPDSQGRLASWPAFMEIWDKAEKDPPNERNQEYWFLAVTNRGSDVIDGVHLRFAGEPEEVVITNLKGGASRIVPLEVSGIHADLIRMRVRAPVAVWFTYQPPAQKAARHDLPIPNRASLQTTDMEDTFEALPNFSQ